MSEAMEEFRKLVVKAGFPVHMGNDFCRRYQSTHKNCFGCEGKNGCDRYCALASVNTTARRYEPKNYSDFQLMQKDISEKMRKILDKKTTAEEIKSLV